MMGRSSRVVSFMSQFGGPPKSPTFSSSSSPYDGSRSDVRDSQVAAAPAFAVTPSRESPAPTRARVDRPPSRPMSMIQPYQPPLMEVAQDTLPELQPIFTFLNSHSNKLYQEGYFLKLNDLDSHGRPNADRTWTECFAQLVGTVLSLWDAAALDAAGEDGEVVPTFINLTDASIKMIETLPTSTKDVQPLQNVLSVSTAGRNRYLLHFNSLHSLTQWTAGIRLAMFEHSTLQELYTGSLIAGKGKSLNNIRVIMERSKAKTEDWVRVRFGAGTPWRRCWCVISPPDEKDYQKLLKQLKKKSAYDRSSPILKGDIKFYDVKKTKKTLPIATITNAYSAYAIYPQSKPLIDQSTLVKVEGTITIHSSPASTSEGFVFVMPEVHPAVSGFEMMLRWLFPVFDTFALYGRPTKLIADTLDMRGLMFAMPTERRYGYLEILDIAGLIHTEGSNRWREADWRKHMKELTAKRIKAMSAGGSRQGSRNGPRRGNRISLNLPSRNGNAHADDGASTRSSPIRHDFPRSSDAPGFTPPPAVGFAPPPTAPYGPPGHQRAVSEAQGLDRYNVPSDAASDTPPPPPPHIVEIGSTERTMDANSAAELDERGDARGYSDHQPHLGMANAAASELPAPMLPEPVAAPTAFARRTSTKALPKPLQSPELRRANSRMSTATLSQLAGASGMATAGAGTAWKSSSSSSLRTSESQTQSPPNEAEDGIDRGLYIGAGRGHQRAEEVDQRGVMMGDRTAGPNADLPAPEAPVPPMTGHHLMPPPPVASTTAPANHPVSLQPGGPLDRASRSIVRKPLPTRPQPSPPKEDHLGSLRDHVYDPEALDQVLARHPTQTSDLEDAQVHRQMSSTSSNYDSEATPDYASTRHSSETKRSATSVERPRAGVMRTVGTVDPPRNEVVVGDTRYQPDAAPPAVQTDIPDVDFGPTYNLTATPRDGTAIGGKKMVQSMLEGPGLSEPLPSSAPGKHSGGSPSRTTGPNRQSGSGAVVSAPDRRSNSRSPSQALAFPPPEHGRTGSPGSGSESDRRRSMAWQPGMMAPGVDGAAVSPRRSLTPEQFVQQRAQQARTTPVYAHQRRSSSQMLRSQTPPMTRHSGGDYSPNSQGRTPPGEYTPRPHSRGGASALGNSGLSGSAGDVSAHLSAREQEHVARATNSPLLNVASGQSGRTQPAPTGLVGAIEAREREKKEMRDGVSNQMVQQAIQQRRQQEAQMMQYGPPNPGGAGNGRPPVPPHQQWSTPGSRMSGGWSSSEMEQQFQQQQLQQQHQQQAHLQQQQYPPPQAPPPPGRGRHGH